jgi:polyvinyl alcohol dehydrogenase (cytochrome)
VIAFDLATGKIVWTRQLHPGGDAWNLSCVTPDRVNCPENEGPDHDVGAAPILRTLASGKRVLLAGQKSSHLHALDPDGGGAVLWSHRLGRGGTLGGIEWGMAADGQNVYAALSDLGIGAEGMDPKVGGGLFAYGLADGRLAWRVAPDPCGDRPGCSPAQSQAVTSLPGVVFSGSIGGILRAYAAVDGRQLWSFDTVKEFATVNGVKAKGGALNGAGPVVAGGRMLVGSGYGRFGQLPGNVLLCFSVDGR